MHDGAAIVELPGLCVRNEVRPATRTATGFQGMAEGY